MARQTANKTPKIAQQVSVGVGTQKAVSKVSRWPLIGVFTVVFGSIGLYMLFRSNAGSIPDGSIFTGRYVLSSDGSDVTPQTYPGEVESTPTGLLIAAPTMSRDGKKIAYYAPLSNKIKTIDSQNSLQSSEISLTTSRKAQSVATMLWNTDTTKLAVQYRIDEGVMRALVVNSDGTNMTELPAAWNVALAGWTPDSSGVVYIKDYQEVCTYSVATQVNNCSKIQGYTTYDEMGGTIRARLAPNGSSVVASFKRAGGGQGKLMLFDVSGAGLRELVVPEQGINITAMAWSPKSENIAYATESRKEGVPPGLHIISVSTKADKLLSNSDQAGDITQLDWVITEKDWQKQKEVAASPTTPDNVTKSVVTTASALGAMRGATLSGRASATGGGKEVAYVVARPTVSSSNPATVQVVSAQGGDARRLVTLPDWSATWFLDGASPDGKWLALRKVAELEKKRYVQETWLIRSDGSDLHATVKQLVGGANEGYSLTWKSDSTGFYYLVASSVASEDPSLCEQDLNGKNKQCNVLNDSTGYLKTALLGMPSAAKDGKSVAFAAKNSANSRAVLYVADTEQHTAIQIKDLGASEVLAMSWSLDGGQIGLSIKGAAGNGVYVVNPDGSGFDQVNPVAEQFVWLPSN